jgi:SAM-dependent methyltransferase
MGDSEDFSVQVRSRKRFQFGRNWRRFLSTVTEANIVSAQQSLARLVGGSSLERRSFLDVGSGSGLSSLAARRLGALVVSFDYDPESVSCTNELRSRFFPEDPDWHVHQMSILDADAVRNLGLFDVVHSSGVLHHTGQMWTAVENTARLVSEDGLLLLTLYNDQGWLSRYWHLVKRAYNAHPLLRPVILAAHLPYLLLLRLAVRLLTGRFSLERGMSYWYDAIDWLGGFPFEVARPQDVLDFLRQQGFEPISLRTCGKRHGCNEYVFRRTANSEARARVRNRVVET